MLLKNTSCYIMLHSQGEKGVRLGGKRGVIPPAIFSIISPTIIIFERLVVVGSSVWRAAATRQHARQMHALRACIWRTCGPSLQHPSLPLHCHHADSPFDCHHCTPPLAHGDASAFSTSQHRVFRYPVDAPEATRRYPASVPRQPPPLRHGRRRASFFGYILLCIDTTARRV